MARQNRRTSGVMEGLLFLQCLALIADGELNKSCESLLVSSESECLLSFGLEAVEGGQKNASRVFHFYLSPHPASGHTLRPSCVLSSNQTTLLFH